MPSARNYYTHKGLHHELLTNTPPEYCVPTCTLVDGEARSTISKDEYDVKTTTGTIIYKNNELIGNSKLRTSYRYRTEPQIDQP